MEKIREEYTLSLHSKLLTINQLYTQDRNEIGYSIWMNMERGDIRAKTFLGNKEQEDICQRFSNYTKKNNQIECIFSTALAYRTDMGNHATSTSVLGMACEQGKIINRKYESSLNALYIIFLDGSSQVLDLSADIYIGGEMLDIQKFEDRISFFKWAKHEKVSFVQTNLLVYDNDIRIDQYKSSKNRYRRILHVVCYSKDSEMYHALYYLGNEYSLYEATELLFNHLKSIDNIDYIHSIMNLDFMPGEINPRIIGLENHKDKFESLDLENSLLSSIDKKQTYCDSWYMNNLFWYEITY